VNIEGTGSREIVEVLKEAYAFPGYHGRNSLWVFGPKSFRVQLGELMEITKFIRKNYSDDRPRTKRAMVVPPGLNAGFAKVWTEMAPNLPFEVKVFHDEEEAVAWLKAG
jgi:hypothetical protein